MKCSNPDCGYVGNDDFCEECGGEMIKDGCTPVDVVRCQGRLKSGLPCDAVLVEGKKFCRFCGNRVNHQLFVKPENAASPESNATAIGSILSTIECISTEESRDTLVDDEQQSKAVPTKVEHERDKQKDNTEVGKSPEKEANIHSENKDDEHAENNNNCDLSTNLHSEHKVNNGERSRINKDEQNLQSDYEDDSQILDHYQNSQRDSEISTADSKEYIAVPLSSCQAEAKNDNAIGLEAGLDSEYRNEKEQNLNSDGNENRQELDQHQNIQEYSKEYIAVPLYSGQAEAKKDTVIEIEAGLDSEYRTEKVQNLNSDDKEDRQDLYQHQNIQEDSKECTSDPLSSGQAEAKKDNAIGLEVGLDSEYRNEEEHNLNSDDKMDRQDLEEHQNIQEDSKECTSDPLYSGQAEAKKDNAIELEAGLDSEYKNEEEQNENSDDKDDRQDLDQHQNIQEDSKECTSDPLYTSQAEAKNDNAIGLEAGLDSEYRNEKEQNLNSDDNVDRQDLDQHQNIQEDPKECTSDPLYSGQAEAKKDNAIELEAGLDSEYRNEKEQNLNSDDKDDRQDLDQHQNIQEDSKECTVYPLYSGQAEAKKDNAIGLEVGLDSEYRNEEEQNLNSDDKDDRQDLDQHQNIQEDSKECTVYPLYSGQAEAKKDNAIGLEVGLYSECRNEEEQNLNSDDKDDRQDLDQHQHIQEDSKECTSDPLYSGQEEARNDNDIELEAGLDSEYRNEEVQNLNSHDKDDRQDLDQHQNIKEDSKECPAEPFSSGQAEAKKDNAIGLEAGLDSEYRNEKEQNLNSDGNENRQELGQHQNIQEDSKEYIAVPLYSGQAEAKKDNAIELEAGLDSEYRNEEEQNLNSDDKDDRQDLEEHQNIQEDSKECTSDPLYSGQAEAKKDNVIEIEAGLDSEYRTEKVQNLNSDDKEDRQDLDQHQNIQEDSKECTSDPLSSGQAEAKKDNAIGLEAGLDSEYRNEEEQNLNSDDKMDRQDLEEHQNIQEDSKECTSDPLYSGQAEAKKDNAIGLEVGLDSEYRNEEEQNENSDDKDDRQDLDQHQNIQEDSKECTSDPLYTSQAEAKNDNAIGLEAGLDSEYRNEKEQNLNSDDNVDRQDLDQHQNIQEDSKECTSDPLYSGQAEAKKDNAIELEAGLDSEYRNEKEQNLNSDDKGDRQDLDQHQNIQEDSKECTVYPLYSGQAEAKKDNAIGLEVGLDSEYRNEEQNLNSDDKDDRQDLDQHQNIQEDSKECTVYPLYSGQAEAKKDNAIGLEVGLDSECRNEEEQNLNSDDKDDRQDQDQHQHIQEDSKECTSDPLYSGQEEARNDNAIKLEAGLDSEYRNEEVQNLNSHDKDDRQDLDQHQNIQEDSKECPAEPFSSGQVEAKKDNAIGLEVVLDSDYRNEKEQNLNSGDKEDRQELEQNQEGSKVCTSDPLYSGQAEAEKDIDIDEQDLKSVTADDNEKQQSIQDGSNQCTASLPAKPGDALDNNYHGDENSSEGTSQNAQTTPNKGGLFQSGDNSKKSDEYETKNKNADGSSVDPPRTGENLKENETNSNAAYVRQPSNIEASGPLQRSQTRTKDPKAKPSTSSRQQKPTKDVDHVQVHFRVLLSADFKFEPNVDKVIVRFGDKSLGGWDSTRWILSFKQKHDTGTVELGTLIPIPKSVFAGSFLEYKYFIERNTKTKKGKPRKSLWEHYVRNWKAGEHVNRFLTQPKWDNWHQFDGLVNREPGKGIWNFLTDYVNGRRKLFSDARTSLKIFAKSISGLVRDRVDKETVRQTVFLTECLSYCFCRVYVVDTCCWDSYAAIKSEVDKHIVCQLAEYAYSFLPVKPVESEAQFSNRMMATLSFMTALKFLNATEIHVDTSVLSAICRSLIPRSQPTTKSYKELDFIKNFPSDWNRNLFKDGLVTVAQMIAVQTNKHPSWMFLVPLIHFLSGACEPYEPINLQFSHDENTPVWWGTTHIGEAAVNDFKTLKRRWETPLHQVIDLLEPYFAMDYLLPRTVMASLSLRDLNDAIQTKQIPLEVSCASIVFFLKETRPKQQSASGGSNWGYVTQDEKDVMECLKNLSSNTSKATDVRVEAPALILRCSISCDMVLEALKTDRRDPVMTSIKVLLYSLKQLPTIERDFWNSEQKTQNLNRLILRVNKGVCQWLRKYSVYFDRDINKALQCWNTTLAPENNTTWNRHIIGGLQEDLVKFVYASVWNTEIYVRFFCKHVSKFKPCLQECLNDIAFEAISRTYGLEIDFFTDSERRQFGKLLSGMFRAYWSETTHVHLIQCLLWPPLQHFIEIVNAKKKGHHYDVLEKDCDRMMKQIILKFDGTYDSLLNGSITIGELKLVHEHRDKFSKLICITFVKHLNLDTVGWAIDCRMKEYQAFNTQAELIKTVIRLCQHLPKVDHTLVDRVLIVHKDPQNHCLSEFCQPCKFENIGRLEDYQPTLSAFNVSGALLNDLPYIDKCYRSLIFRQIWQKTCEEYEDKCRDVDEVFQHVWIPVKKKWNNLSAEIQEENIKFHEMEKLVGNAFPDNCSELKEELKILGLTEEIIIIRVKQLQQYRKLGQSIPGAIVIQQLAETYGLTGGFQNVLNIAKFENPDFEMKEFDSVPIDTDRFLHELSEEQLQCLRAFVTCGKLVKWLRESMSNSGLKELKVFVDLALISAGDEPMNIARVQCLHSAVTGYAPLIFDLKQTDDKDDYKQLQTLCSIVWKELESNRNLPKQLEDTNRQLEWLKQIKESHGSVEVTSLSQAEAIDAGGIYRVGKALPAQPDQQQCLDHLQTISLIVSGDNQPDGNQRIYTCGELMDLQSRLMLVAGKAHQGNDSVERFTETFDSVTRLSQINVKLCRAGCVLFKDWTVTFACDVTEPDCTKMDFGKGQLIACKTENEDLQSVISKLVSFMESCYTEWLQYIKDKRAEYLQLNYFTMDQLVILQQELVKISTDNEPSQIVYPLLSAVKSNCTKFDLIEAMTEAKSNIQEATAPQSENADNTEELKQEFVRQMEESGYSEYLARKALESGLDPDQVSEGICWCLEHEEPESDIAFESWSQSDVSFASLIFTETVEKRYHDGVGPLVRDLKKLWSDFLNSLSTDVMDYINLEHLGIILGCLARRETKHIARTFPPSFSEGRPNLVMCPQTDVLHTALAFYMFDQDRPLPKSDEVLLCSPETTVDEVDIFLRRALFHKGGKIYCLVNADILDFSVSEECEQNLEEYIQRPNSQEKKSTRRYSANERYRLIVICGSDSESHSRIVTSLLKHKHPTLPYTPVRLKEYIANKLHVCATTDDKDKRSSVRLIKSWRAGVGKTLYQVRMGEEFSSLNPKALKSVTIPLKEKKINHNRVVQRLLKNTAKSELEQARMFHIDIAHEVQYGADFLLFNLLVLGSLTDKRGYVWRKSPLDLYLIEAMPLLMHHGKDGGGQYVHQMLGMLPEIVCRSPQESLDIYGNAQDQLFDKTSFESAEYQRPYQYLCRQDKGRPLTDIQPDTPEGNPEICLQTLLGHCGLYDPSWSELHHFVSFLNTQLQDFEQNEFVGAAAAEDLPGFAQFVLSFLIQMSRDFSTRSLNMSEDSPGLIPIQKKETTDTETNEEVDNAVLLGGYQLRRTWECSPHPYLFFSADRDGFTFLGFNIDPFTRNLIDRQTGNVLQEKIMDRVLYQALVHNRIPIKEYFDHISRQEKIVKLCSVLGNDLPHDPDNTYELTTDNAKKIMAIFMRFRCNIPVIIMGETGCGKTRLVKFMCALQSPPDVEVNNMILMKVHGGITAADIIRNVRDAEQIAQQNVTAYGRHMYTVLFFDEANTTESIGLIKEIMCDRSMEGEKLELCDNLKMVAACNPYRKHSDELIQKLEKAGLGYHIKADETTDKLGNIPMRRLVYRVQPLPHSLLPLVWDFGQLNAQVEELYIRQMVRRYIREDRLPYVVGLPEVFSSILTASQQYMRSQKDECSFVSLRDVDRVLLVTSWFYEQKQKTGTLFNEMDAKLDKIDEQSAEVGEKQESMTTKQARIYKRTELFESSEEVEECDDLVYDEDDDDDYDEAEDDEEEYGTIHIEPRRIDDITRALVLALGVCYHACLKTRADYRDYIAGYFEAPCVLPGGSNQIENEINICQDVFLDNVQLERNIARNMALKENVFMMVICIELRIPLFLVGKPGSSKSLSKIIVSDAMQGNTSRSKLFREFKQVQMVSFQCSPLSTPDSIIGTFKQCAQFQKGKDLETFVSVVVLDEVGLAEDSPRMPLKTLHPLLEDGCQGSESPEPYKKVAFIGISNWALDPAKMNRGILVQRDVPDMEEMCNTARGICTSSGMKEKMEPLIEPLAKSYSDIFEKATQHMREFYGLRDFYSLVKMLNLFVERSKNKPTWHELVHSIKRNFGGMDDVDPMECFKKNVCTIVTPEDRPQQNDPDCDTTGLIQACLFDKHNIHSESRYLLLLTENYGALTILQQQVLARQTDIRPITIFGSSFRNDQEYTQICRNINKIKVCMETGNTVILLNLENLYESLYDALNQYYVYLGGERFVDLGLGTHRVKCLVHRKFRLIVVAEKQTVYKKFPIPLINRLEKHLLTVKTMLTDVQQQYAKELEQWANDFAKPLPSPRFRVQNALKVEDVFIGYHHDTCSAIILHVWEDSLDGSQSTETKILQKMLEAKKMLLWCATPESEVRLENTNLSPQEQTEMSEIYHKQQSHDNILAYLNQKIVQEKREWLLSQVTTHSSLLVKHHIEDISKATNILPTNVALLDTLTSFDTEQQFSKKVNQHFKRQQITPEKKEITPKKKEITPSLLIIQCDSGDVNADLVACARYCVMGEYEKVRELLGGPAHIVFIIQLSRIAGGCFSGFQCGKWHSAHIDELYSTDLQLPPVQDMQDKSVATLVEEAEIFTETQTESIEDSASDKSVGIQNVTLQLEAEDSHDESSKEEGLSIKIPYTTILDVKGLIRQSLHAALSMVKDNPEHGDRSTDRVGLLLQLLHQPTCTGEFSIHRGLARLILALLKEKEKKTAGSFLSKKWLNNEAAKQENMQKTGTFKRACVRTLETKITPILAGVIAHLDTNQNLNFVSKEAKPWQRRLWQNIVSSPEAISLKYVDLQSPMGKSELSEFNVKATDCGGRCFKAMMPFSWEICELVDKVVGQPRPYETRSDVTAQSLRNTPLGRVLQENSSDGGVATIYKSYLIDFVHIKYNAETEREHRLICESIDKESQRTQHGEEEREILQMIVCVHESFNKISKMLTCFRMICNAWPDCIVAYTESVDKSDTIGDSNMSFAAVHLLVENLAPGKNALDEPKGRKDWLETVYRYRPVVENVFKTYTEHAEIRSLSVENRKHIEETRQLWNRVVIMKLFLEHICVNDEKDEEKITVKHCMPLWMLLRKKGDMKKEKILTIVEKFLASCRTKAMNTLSGEGTEKMLEYQRRCSTFFMDVVSQLCFTENSPPSDGVITKLIKYVTHFVNEGQMSVLDIGIDPTPVFKSFLLHHLLRTSDERKIVSQFLAQVHETSKGSAHSNVSIIEEHCIQLSVQVIQCLEDLYNDRGKEDVINYAATALQHCKEFIDEKGLTMDKLLSLAEARMGLAVAAVCIRNPLDKEPNRSSRKLIEVAGLLCTSTDNRWPLTYLVKYICREFGIDVYHNICSQKAYRWLDQSDLGGQVPDMYLVLGDGYRALRESLSQVIQGNDEKVLEKTYQSQRLNTRDACRVDMMLQLAIYREVTCSNLCQPVQRAVSDKILSLIDGLTRKHRKKQTELTESLLHNTLSDRLTVRQGQDFHTQGIQCLLVHYLCILSHLQEDQSLMQPLIGMLKQPQNFANAFIPTMPQDNLVDIKEALVAANIRGENPVIYRCPNGHHYVIGDCGQPYHLGNCKWCGEDIGGESGRLQEGNTPYQSVDETKRGHILGPVALRGQGASSERTLSPVQCACIRLFTHMSLYLASLQNVDQMEELFTPMQTDIPSFLWDHITADLMDLQQVFERSNDDVLLLMHSIMSTLLDQNESEDVLDKDVCTLSSKTGRAKWEQLFSDNILQPVLRTADFTIQTNYQLLVNGTRLGGNLLCLLYETGTVDQTFGVDMLQEVPAVWRYRIPISLTHLKQEVDNNASKGRDGQKQHKVLQGFLEYEPILRALRYIPSILKLQRGLLQKYQRRLDKAEASTITIRDIMKDKTLGDDTEHLLEDFKAAWDIVRVHLRNHACSSQHGDVRLGEEYCSRRLDERTPISALLPSNKEAGLCSYVLIDFLLRKQNEFIDSYLGSEGSSMTYTVSPAEVTSARLISFDPQNDLLPLIHANCQYSFEIGKGTKIEYDFTSLERQLKDRFLFSKPRIDIGKYLQIELMVYRTEFTNAAVLAELADKITQTTLSAAVKSQICSEMRSLPELCQSMDRLDIAISFLKSIGGSKTSLLTHFMEETLQMPVTFYSQKAQQNCEFQHARSLWLLFAMQRSKLMFQNRTTKQNIFESVHTHYLEETPESCLEKCQEYLKNLTVERLSPLVQVLHEFILLVVAKPQNTEDEDFEDNRRKTLGVYLQVYADGMECSNMDSEMLTGLPEDVLFIHSVHLWMMACRQLIHKQTGQMIDIQ